MYLRLCYPCYGPIFMTAVKITRIVIGFSIDVQVIGSVCTVHVREIKLDIVVSL